MSDTTPESSEIGDGTGGESRARTIRRIAVRLLITLVGLTVAFFVLNSSFADLDFEQVISDIRSLDDAETLALIGSTAIMIFAEALLTSSFVAGMPARRGALAWLGPTAVASMIPGPSDMPVRYRMFVSWDYPNSAAATAVGASAVLNMVAKLVLPAIAGIGLVVADIQLQGVAATIVSATVMLAVLLAISAYVLGSESRTATAGRVLDRVWRTILRLLRREPSDGALADLLVEQRATALDILHGRWWRATLTMAFVTIARVSLFVMCIRFAGVPESAVSWQAMFCVWAIVRGLTVIPIMPGNAGLSELAFVGMLTPIAGQEYVNQITAGVLIFRILTWLLMIPVGIGALGLWKLGLKRSADTSSPA